MNQARRVVLTLYLLALGFACVYLPWKDVDGPYYTFVGYRFLWSPPHYPFNPENQIEWERIALEVIALTAVCGVALLIGTSWSRASLPFRGIGLSFLGRLVRKRERTSLWAKAAESKRQPMEGKEGHGTTLNGRADLGTAEDQLGRHISVPYSEELQTGVARPCSRGKFFGWAFIANGTVLTCTVAVPFLATPDTIGVSVFSALCLGAGIAMLFIITGAALLKKRRPGIAPFHISLAVGVAAIVVLAVVAPYSTPAVGSIALSLPLILLWYGSAIVYSWKRRGSLQAGKQLQTTSEKTPFVEIQSQTLRPYRWGHVFGLIVAVLGGLTIIMVIQLVATTTLDTFGIPVVFVEIGLFLTGSISIWWVAIGLGLILRKRWALTSVYIISVLAALTVLSGALLLITSSKPAAKDTRLFGNALVMAILWGGTLFYLRKRRHEFK